MLADAPICARWQLVAACVVVLLKQIHEYAEVAGIQRRFWNGEVLRGRSYRHRQHQAARRDGVQTGRTVLSGSDQFHGPARSQRIASAVEDPERAAAVGRTTG